ncbi:hypothetical protein [Streptococcus sp. DD12]|uniref:hypothetical protein n=1 Tax=Streptococcus sp. DD12 TaxID=1777880 RepID=UPI00079A83D3|nr:hypothetical protein [Streptococcus sp. DD12]KXT76532.1 hypothetical protein STRDD12_00412 [Streptococcus sp. DD12]
MTLKDKLSTFSQQAKTHWKKTALISVAVLGVGTAGGAIGYAVANHGGPEMEQFQSQAGFGGEQGEMDFEGEDFSSQEDFEGNSSQTLTYDQWTSAVNKSDLSSADKKTFLAALEKSKTNIDKASSLSDQLDKLYSDNLSSLDTEFDSLMSKNSSLWEKLDDAWLPQSLRDLSTDDLTDLAASIKASDSLSDSEKSTLQADVASLKSLKEKWSTAYASYTEKAADLESQLETAENAVTTSLKDNKVTDDMLASVTGDEEGPNGNADAGKAPGKAPAKDKAKGKTDKSSSSSKKSATK